MTNPRIFLVPHVASVHAQARRTHKGPIVGLTVETPEREGVRIGLSLELDDALRVVEILTLAMSEAPLLARPEGPTHTQGREHCFHTKSNPVEPGMNPTLRRKLTDAGLLLNIDPGTERYLWACGVALDIGDDAATGEAIGLMDVPMLPDDVDGLIYGPGDVPNVSGVCNIAATYGIATGALWTLLCQAVKDA